MLHKYEEFLESLTASESETQTDSPKQTARTNQPGIWTYSPGEGARKWTECQDKNMMFLGWDDMEDFNTYKSRQEIVENLRSVYGNAKIHTQTIALQYGSSPMR